MLKINRTIPVGSIKLLLFDLDGTLVDSRLDLANAINAMLRHLGRPELPCDLIATYIGDGAPMLVRRALGDPDDPQFVDDAIHFFMGWYRGHLLDNTVLYPGISEVLEALNHAGLSNSLPDNASLGSADGRRWQMAVLSNKPVNPSRKIVEGLGIARYFFRVYGGNSFHTKKPDPYGALKLCEEAGVRPAEALMIGDSSNDVLTGRNAGMWTLGLTYGLAPQTLGIAPPDVLIDTPQEILTVLEPPAAAPVRSGSEAETTPPSPS